MGRAPALASASAPALALAPASAPALAPASAPALAPASAPAPPTSAVGAVTGVDPSRPLQPEANVTTNDAARAFLRPCLT